MSDWTAPFGFVRRVWLSLRRRKGVFCETKFLLLQSHPAFSNGVLGLPLSIAAFAIRCVLAGFLPRFDIVQGTFEGAFGLSLLAIGKREFFEVFGCPLRFVRLAFIDGGFDGTVGAISSPEEPVGDGGLFNEEAGLESVGAVVVEQAVQERFEGGRVFSGDDEFGGRAAVEGGVAAGAFSPRGRLRGC
jgi:hypothetical protein